MNALCGAATTIAELAVPAAMPGPGQLLRRGPQPASTSRPARNL